MPSSSFHLTAQYAHVVVEGRLHLLDCTDVRFPWVVQAALGQGVSMQEALMQPAPHDPNPSAVQWTVVCDAIDEDTYFDFQDSVQLACARFQTDRQVRQVRVVNNFEETVFSLRRQ